MSCFFAKKARNPVPEQLRMSYLRFFDDHPLSSHLGFHKMLDKILGDSTSWGYATRPPPTLKHATHVKPSNHLKWLKASYI